MKLIIINLQWIYPAIKRKEVATCAGKKYSKITLSEKNPGEDTQTNNVSPTCITHLNQCSRKVSWTGNEPRLSNKKVNFTHPMVKGKVHSYTKRNGKVRKEHFFIVLKAFLYALTVFNFSLLIPTWSQSNLSWASLHREKSQYNKRPHVQKLTQNTSLL